MAKATEKQYVVLYTIHKEGKKWCDCRTFEGYTKTDIMKMFYQIYDQKTHKIKGVWVLYDEDFA